MPCFHTQIDSFPLDKADDGPVPHCPPRPASNPPPFVLVPGQTPFFRPPNLSAYMPSFPFQSLPLPPNRQRARMSGFPVPHRSKQVSHRFDALSRDSNTRAASTRQTSTMTTGLDFSYPDLTLALENDRNAAAIWPCRARVSTFIAEMVGD